MTKSLFCCFFPFIFLNISYGLLITNSYFFQDLISTNSSDFVSEISSWAKLNSVSPSYSSCSQPILGGYQIGGDYARVYNSLPSHNQISLDLDLYILDDWVFGDSLTIWIENSTFLLNQIGRQGASSPYTSNICGDSGYNDLGLVHFRAVINHTSTSMTLNFTSNLTYVSSRASYGIRNVAFRLYNSSLMTKSGCFILPTGFTSSSMCPCQAFNQLLSLGSCINCSNECGGCVESAKNCIFCSDGYYFNGTGCSSCPANCSKCSNSTYCTHCGDSFFLLSNGTCSATCPSPMINSTNPIWKCYSLCNSSQFLYWDSSCESTCASPLIQSTFSGSKLCLYKCTSATQHLYWDGNCNTQCQSYFNSTRIKGKLFCIWPCANLAHFLYYSNKTCLSTCTSPYTTSTIKSRKLCNEPCSTTKFYMPNKTCSNTCPIPFVNISIGTINYCNFPCNSTAFLYQDSSCRSTCSNPLLSRTSENITYCYCDFNAPFYFPHNNSCAVNCNQHFSLARNNFLKYCNQTCFDYMLANGTCVKTCKAPFKNLTQGNFKFCDFSCLDGYYLNSSGTCVENCTKPYMKITVGVERYCVPQCGPNKFYFDDDTCNSTCLSPLIYYETDGIKYCKTPCSDPSQPYLLKNGSCVADCNSPWILNRSFQYLMCDSPCEDNQYLTDMGNCIASCNSPLSIDARFYYNYCSNPCRNAYLLQNGTCIDNCLSPMIISNASGYKSCKFPCPNEEFMTQSGECVSSCEAPLVILDGLHKFCQTPCPDSFALRNGTCISDCLSPWISKFINQYLICDTKCNLNQYLDSSGNCLDSCSNPDETQPYKYCQTPNNKSIVVCSGSNPYMKFDTLSCTDKCRSPYIPSPNISYLCVFMPTSSTPASKLSSTVTSTIKVTTAIQSTIGSASGGALAAFGMMTTNRFLYYTRFLLINYPENLVQYFIEANNSAFPSLGVTLPSDGINFPPYRPIPNPFEGWGLQSSFIVNYWSTFSTIVVAFGAAVFLWALQKICQRSKKIELAYFFEKLMYIFKWNFVLIVFCTGYDSIMLYATCEFRTASFDSFMNIFSFFVAIVCVLLAIYYIALTYWLASLQFKIRRINRIVSSIGNLETIKSLEEINPVKIFMRNWQSHQILFTGYKDDTAFARGFIFIFMLRNVFWILVLSLLYQYPVVQISIMASISYTMLILMLWKKPFVNLVSKFEIPATECVAAYVYTCILALAIMDKAGIEDPDMRTRLGQCIIFGFIAFGIIVLICLAGYFVLGLYIGIKKYREMKAAGSLTLISLFTIPFVSYGMDFDEFETNIKNDHQVVIKKDSRTKELALIKLKPFRPVTKLLRRFALRDDIFVDSSTPSNLSRIRSVHSKTMLFKRPKLTQVVPIDSESNILSFDKASQFPIPGPKSSGMTISEMKSLELTLSSTIAKKTDFTQDPGTPKIIFSEPVEEEILKLPEAIHTPRLLRITNSTRSLLSNQSVRKEHDESIMSDRADSVRSASRNASLYGTPRRLWKENLERPSKFIVSNFEEANDSQDEEKDSESPKEILVQDL